MIKYRFERLFVVFLIGVVTFNPSFLDAQDSLSSKKPIFFKPASQFSRQRFNYAAGFAGATYTAFSVGLYNSWYKDYPMSSFHLFNDWGEWEQMDKAAHAFSGYFQAILTYKGARWTGLKESKSIWTGIAIGSLFQTTIEVMDGFSKEWGFSIADIAANTVGIGVFSAQQRYWGEQRLTIKESAFPVKHSASIFIESNNGGDRLSLKERADQLYGSSLAERLLKDYNAQTYWLSCNVDAFLPKGNRWPDWLNVAVGYGAQNMYGGFENQWMEDDMNYDGSGIARYRQFYFALDADLTKIQTKNHFLRSLLSVANIFKTPCPAVEITSNGEVIFHFVHF
jgi:hypothetical protein